MKGAWSCPAHPQGDEQIGEVMLITYDVWFCSLPAPVPALTFSNLSSVVEEEKYIYIVWIKKKMNNFEIHKLLYFIDSKV